MNLKSIIQKNVADKHRTLPQYLAISFFIFFAYFGIAHLSLTLATLNKTVSPVWPATGVAIGLIIIFGMRFLPAVFLGAFVANYFTKIPIPCLFAIAGGNTLEIFTASVLVKNLSARKDKFGPFITTFSVFIGSVAGGAISATVGISALIYFDQANLSMFTQLWPTWFLANSLGGIIIFPLLMVFYKHFIIEPINHSTSWLTFLSLLVIGLILSWLLFILPNGAPFLFLVFPYLMLCVEKSGDKGVTLATVLLAICGIISIKLGHGVFLHGTSNSNFVNLQFFLVSIGLCSLILSDLKRIGSLKRPSIVLMISWFIAGSLFFIYNYKSNSESEKHFNSLVESVEPLLDARIDLYFSALQNGIGLFAASESVSREEWSKFINQSDFFRNLPGLKWLGVVYPVPKNKLPEFIAQQKKSRSDFNYHSLKNLSAADIKKSKSLETAFIVTYLEPLRNNEASLGLDIAGETHRRETAQQAADAGKPFLTRRILLRSMKYPTWAFVAFYPIYKDGKIPPTVKERRANLIGWTYGPISVDDFFGSVFSKGTLNELSYSVFDTSDSEVPVSISPNFDQLTSKIAKKTITLENRKFTFYFKRSSAFSSGEEDFTSWAGALTSIISILLGTFIVSLLSTRSSALALAAKKNEELKSSEELLKFALEGSGDSVWDWDIKKGVKFSPLLQKMLGFSADARTFVNFDEWKTQIHPDDLERAVRELTTGLAENIEYRSEYRLRCKNGTYKWFLSRGKVAAIDNDRKPLRMVGTISDITKRKKFDEAIESERAKLFSIFEGSTDGILLFSDTEFIDCNSSALSIFGFSSKKDFVNNYTESLKLNPQPLGINFFTNGKIEIDKALKRGRSHFEWEFRKKYGETFTGEIVLSSFKYDEKIIIQAVVRNINDKKFYESSLQRQREMLEASAKMSSLGEMAGGIAHEINNPLSIIVGKSTQIKRQLKTGNTEKIVEDINLIESTAKRIAAIIKGLKAFSRNAEKDEMQKVLVPALIKDILELSAQRFKFNLIDLHYQQNVSDEVYVYCRTAQLLQVMVNLINNAFDAVEQLDDKWVTIELNTVADICQISITDSGMGIDRKIVNKIMSPFFTTKPVDKGTGLGLSISKTIIEEHGGQLYYDYHSKHTRFIIELPLAQLSAEQFHH